MARIRTIKPEFWEDEKIAELPMSCRLFFIGCWNYADDFGMIKGNAILLKSQIFPYDEDLRVVQLKEWIDALVNARFLIPICHRGESYYFIRTFRTHQVLDKRYEKSFVGKEIVNELIDSALKEYNVDIPKTQCDHDVNTTCSHSDHDAGSGSGNGKGNGKGSGVGSGNERDTQERPDTTPFKEIKLKDGDNYIDTTTIEVFKQEYPKLLRWIDDNAPQVAQMKAPFTYDELYKCWYYSNAFLQSNFFKEIITEMNNKVDLPIKYHSAFTTFTSFAKQKKQKTTRR